MQLEDIKLIENSVLFEAVWCKKTYEGCMLCWPIDSIKNPDVRDADLNALLHFEKYGFKEGRYRDEIKKVMPEILKRHTNCKADLNGGLLRIRITNACNAKCRYCGVRLGFGEEVNHAMIPSWYYELAFFH